MIGYVRIHRSLIGHPAFRNDAESMAFAWMIARAAWKPQRVRYKGKAISLDRGQLAISQRDMAHDMDRDKAWIERLWKRLRAEAMIEVGSEAGVAVITICNYAEYQASGDDREAVDEAPQEADVRQTQGTEQVKEEGKKEVGRTRKRARSPDFEIPDFVPAEPWAAFAEMRARKKKPLDGYTAKQLFGRLRSIADAGWDLDDVINKAVTGCHDGFWMPDGRDQNLRRASSPTNGHRSMNRVELQAAIAFAEDHQNPERAAELKAQLAKLRERPPDPAVSALVTKIAQRLHA